MTNRVLVGDVGGTNVRFGVAEDSASGITIHDFLKMPGDDFGGFEDALEQYLEETDVRASLPAVFALAGPPVDGIVKLTNRDWHVSEQDLIKRFGHPSVHLANDFTAMARAVPELDRSHFELIKPGITRPGAPIVVAGPGTGFGVATLLPLYGNRWRVMSGEGGFMTYAPRTDIEIKLTAYLSRKYDFVYNELVCAGVGLDDVHEGLCEIFGKPYEPKSPSDMLELAAAGDDLFRELCYIRARGTMSAVGDLVLANGARGGVVLAGGVSERLAVYLKSPDAMARFAERGRNSAFVAECPIHLMHDPVAPLIGAAALYLKDT